jgi:hypothetical protein
MNGAFVLWIFVIRFFCSAIPDLKLTMSDSVFWKCEYDDGQMMSHL